MTGIAEFNAPAFAKYAEKYRAKGFAVVSPPEMDAGDYHQPYTTYIRRDVTRLLQGDIEAVYLLPGWENSKGARLEKHLAEVMGLRVCDAETGEPLVEETKVNLDPRVQTMPSESAERKGVPLCSGVLDYFPAALAAVARLSKYGNDKHNPGEPLHWARGKSADHADCILRHLADRGIMDNETGLSHTVEVAWRALALLQEEEETRGAARPRGAY
jgi:hypothetical protein